MQIWSIETENKERFGMKVIYSGTDREAWEQYYTLTVKAMNTSKYAELWLVEENQDKIFETKAKFKWEKH